MRDEEEGANATVPGGAEGPTTAGAGSTDDGAAAGHGEERSARGSTGDPRAAGQGGGHGDDEEEAARERTASKLGSLVQMEAHRMVSEASIRPDPERLAEGWERRFIADGRRAEEAVDLYRELGYEVVADPVRPEDLAGECEACRIVAMMSFKSIYTRRRPREGPPDVQGSGSRVR